MKPPKVMQSRQAGVNTIKRKRQEKNGEIEQNDTAGIASPSPDSDQEGFQRLERLLRSADKAFTDPDHPYCPEKLHIGLFASVAELQHAIGKRKNYRIPFWNCVLALDHARPKFRLKSRLRKLVKRACKIPPSPLATLRTSQQLNAHELALVDDIAKALFDYGDAPASDVLAKWAPVLERVNSSQCKAEVEALERDAVHIMVPRVNHFIAFTRWIDFAWQSAKWMARYRPAVWPLYSLVVRLQNPDFDKQLRNVVPWHCPVRDNAKMKSEMAKLGVVPAKEPSLTAKTASATG